MNDRRVNQRKGIQSLEVFFGDPTSRSKATWMEYLEPARAALAKKDAAQAKASTPGATVPPSGPLAGLQGLAAEMAAVSGSPPPPSVDPGPDSGDS
jgi:hypothetical protein